MNVKAHVVLALLVGALLLYDYFLVNPPASGKLVESAHEKDLPRCVQEYAKYYASLHPSVTYQLIQENGKLKLYATDGNNEWWVWRGLYLEDTGQNYSVTIFFYEPYYVKDYVVFKVNLSKSSNSSKTSFVGYLKAEKTDSGLVYGVKDTTFRELQYLVIHNSHPEDILIAKNIADQIKELAKYYNLSKTAELVIAHEIIRTIYTNDGWSLNYNENWLNTGKVTIFALNGSHIEKHDVNLDCLIKGLLLSGGKGRARIYEVCTIVEIYILKELGFSVKEFEYTPIQESGELNPRLSEIVNVNPYLIAINSSQIDYSELAKVFHELPKIKIKLTSTGSSEELYLLDPIPDPSWHSVPFPHESKAILKDFYI